MNAIEQMLAAKTIAIVGLSDDPSRVSHEIGRYLHEHGYAITPVNPAVKEVFGLKAVASLDQLGFAPDVVLVFRRPEFCEAIAKDAIAVGAKGVWLQSGIASDGARRVCEAARFAYVEDRCFYVEHGRRA
jgi:predicted CoA-binding protein